MKSREYPLATICRYGPDYLTATKLVAAIFTSPGQPDPVAMKKWLTATGEVSEDPLVKAELDAFIQSQGVAKSVWREGVLGCPHEEGIDYPAGETCPHCPFWASLDRSTMEPKSLDLPLTPDQIIAGLYCNSHRQPLMSFAAAERYRDQMIEPFVRLIEDALVQPQKVTADAAMVFSYALAFLVHWREPRAFSLVLRWLTLPGEAAFALGGDTPTEWGGRMLATVCGGDLAPIQQLILNQSADGFCRGQGLVALKALVAAGTRSQQEIADYFGWLAREGLEREPGQIWNELAGACADLDAIAVFDDLRRAMEEDLIDTTVISRPDLEEIAAQPRGLEFDRVRAALAPFGDVEKETAWWACFGQSPWSHEAGRESDSSWLESAQPPPPTDLPEYVPPPPPVPYVAPPKTGRNEPCPCGSGKKFKKCCGK